MNGTRPVFFSRCTELDGLRFFAVLGVMAVHFSPNWLGEMGPWGAWGVRFFFVLSGFLITQLLISARTRVDDGWTSASVEYIRFSVRRALRLWPSYFLATAGAAALGLAYAQDMLPWNLLFVGNYYVVVNDHWPTIMSHLWTLAVEQQFYVLWPVLILMAPPRGILAGLWLLIIAGPVFRMAEVAWGLGVNVHFVQLPSCVDYFAWGGLLAWTASKTNSPGIAVRRPEWLAGLLAIICLVSFHYGAKSFPVLWPAIEGVLLALASLLLIRHCTDPRDSWIKVGLRQPAFVYLGRISYGIYLYHNFAHWAGPGILGRLTGERYFTQEWMHVLYYVALTIVVSAASWHLLEKPLERLRHRITSQ